MSKEIMSAEQWFRAVNVQEFETWFDTMQAYARYVIESLTDEEIREWAEKQYPNPVGSNEIGKVTGIIRGMKQAQQILLNRIK